MKYQDKSKVVNVELTIRYDYILHERSSTYLNLIKDFEPYLKNKSNLFGIKYLNDLEFCTNYLEWCRII